MKNRKKIVLTANQRSHKESLLIRYFEVDFFSKLIKWDDPLKVCHFTNTEL